MKLMIRLVWESRGGESF